MKTTSSVVLPVLGAFLSLVNAHGFVSKFTVDGTSYNGNIPGGASNPSPIRQISTIDPVKGASNPNMACGQNAQNAALVASAKPGSSISFLWGDPYGTNWPHNTGPLMTYMASCGSVTCDKFDATNAQWFKIDEAGKKPGSPSTWVQQDIMNGLPYTTMIPANLASGGYLIRHEIIALHLAMTVGGAEFYPSCMQVNVQGSGTQTPSPNDLVSFPGAYKDTDPGIFDPNVYTPSSAYTFPGPAIATFITGAGSGSGSGSLNTSIPSSVPSSSSSQPSHTSLPLASSPSNGSGSSAIPSSSGSCSPLKKRSLVKRNTFKRELARENTVNSSAEQISPTRPRPRHLSRVMGRLNHKIEW